MAFMAGSSWRCRPRPTGPTRRRTSACSARCRASSSPRCCAFWAGEFVNSYVLAQMKIWTGGRHLWTRTIGSTIVGRGGRQPDLLSARLLGRGGVHACAGDQGAVHAMGAEGGWEVLLTPGDLCRRRRAEARRGRRRVRRGHRLLAVPGEGLSAKLTLRFTLVAVFRRAVRYARSRRIRRCQRATSTRDSRNPTLQARLIRRATSSSRPSNSRRPSSPPCAASICVRGAASCRARCRRR